MSSTTPNTKNTATPPADSPPPDGKFSRLRKDLKANIKEFWVSLAREDWEPKVEARLTNKKLLNECERNVAYAAWMHALSERKSKQLGVLSIPTAAIALAAALISADKSGSIFTTIAVVAVFLVAAIVAAQLLLTRDIEALTAAAAVHEHRASGTCNKPADTSNGNRPPVGPNQGHSQGESEEE